MSEAPGLFDIPTDTAPALHQDLPIRSEQVQQIREAFDRAGISEQGERKALINSVVIRDIASLRELHAVEVRRVLNTIEQRAQGKPSTTGSSWDDREEETWIDKL
ncbi:hypothetical protein [Arthrobacter bambusae]|uniref:hypothetical protein n=1 Tax=Arthrobacter bambusae TaxID=1338426 RepID=UPI00278BAA56|nr:hypothetical protein [Arthrobacter bambusae]MDQ0031523.1 DNA polymerase-3 subunit epsilon [Arthrobacter bambusae]MDQ0099746.1 DNA polymerase-3 subunit epsilon [Arthrobacter bambusae]